MKYKDHFELIKKPMTECSSSLSFELEFKQVKPFDFSKLNLVDTNIVESINKKVYENLGIAEDTLILREALYKASIYDKLCKDLGCPLEVAFKALKEGIYTEKIDNTLLISKDVSLKHNGKQFVFILEHCYYVVTKNYKKTWWLKKDRSE